ncbi:hypothetical protein [Ferrovibrio terrae]|uniref:hypothetical protein n=1 Tax=Ferrovibrio terrae TaxID=2594003 RepID=UPI0031382078
MIRSILSRLRALLAALRPQPSPAADRPTIHIAIASHTRRYPGRSSALDLRLSQGWISPERRLAHQDRRA